MTLGLSLFSIAQRRCHLRFWLSAIFYLFSFNICFAQLPFDEMDIPENYQQIVFVQTENWDSPTGKLMCYFRDGDNWIGQELSAEVVVGKNGLGWGRGVHANGLEGPEKVEGDGKAPAGIFEIGDAFGYSASFTAGTTLSYRALTDRDYFIDDVNSEDYNQWKTIPADKENNPRSYWGSYERMKRSDHLYELGLIVQHNADPVLKGNGSAIFMHVWRQAGSPTVGCTAMDKEILTKLISWLDPSQSPLLIQIPAGSLEQIKFK